MIEKIDGRDWPLSNRRNPRQAAGFVAKRTHQAVPNHRYGRVAALSGFALYSITLAVIEVNTSQSYVRNFFTDIEGPTPFYAVNTSLSVSLLLATGLLFAVCASCVKGLPSLSRWRWFYLSQAVMFAYFAIDDRFKIHESVAERIGIGDHFVLVSAAILEILFLVRLGGAELLRSPGRWGLLAAWCLSLLMISIDALAPHEAVLRLSIEDLAKTGASLAFFFWSWDTLNSRLEALKAHGKETVS